MEVEEERKKNQMAAIRENIRDMWSQWGNGDGKIREDCVRQKWRLGEGTKKNMYTLVINLKIQAIFAYLQRTWNTHTVWTDDENHNWWPNFTFHKGILLS